MFPQDLLIVPALPTTLDIPDFKAMSDVDFITFAAESSDLFLQKDNRNELSQQLRLDCINRIRRIMLSKTAEGMKQSLKNNINNIYCLMEVYTFTVTGAPIQGSFIGPRHLWSTDQLEEQIIEFFTVDEQTHNFQNTNAMLDFMWLYRERITKEK